MTDEAAAPANHGADHGTVAHPRSPASDSGQPHDREPSGMTCCPAMQCPATVAVPQAALLIPLSPMIVSVLSIPADHQLDGIPVDPALRPPRVA